ncbi:MerR family transcriptional regulator [Bacillus toyonensis]|uniref:MerR family transcriptional regulator n=1 Tax=Bacillus toyonensis TaxID=155322 RepID=UPI002E1EE919|nr:MerR family transcriptional regulator [Bacillus toyonensis]MED3087791.1 MerR family transcriptional regulator [Bacillus toyonensis]
MDDNMDNTTQEKAYWAAEVADRLKTNTSTLRNWTNALEKESYQFIKDANGRRAFLEKDIENLKLLQKCLKNNMSMKDAVHAVISSVEGQIRTGLVREKERPLLRPLSADVVEGIVSEALEIQQKEFEEKMEKQSEDFEKMLNQKLTEQAEFLLKNINELTKERDRTALEFEMKKIEETKKNGFQKLLGFFKS